MTVSLSIGLDIHHSNKAIGKFRKREMAHAFRKVECCFIRAALHSMDVQGVRLSAAVVVPITQVENTGAATPSREEAQAAPSTACDPAATGEIIVQVKEAWRHAYKAMMNVEPPAVVRAAAETAMVMTGKYWTFTATDAVEAVIKKCTQRMPLIFANPALDTALRTLKPEATAVMWAQTKRQRKAATGPSSYIPEVTGKFDSM